MKRLHFEKAPIFWASANILCVCWYFRQAPIFYVHADILGKRQYFDNFCLIILLDLLLQIFVYIFSIYLCIFVCANIFGAIVLKPRFKIDVLVVVIWSIVIIINSVLTLQVSTASLPQDREPCKIKVVSIGQCGWTLSNHNCSLHTCVCAGSRRERVRLSGLINGRNQFNSWGFPQAPHSGPGLCRTLIMKKVNKILLIIPYFVIGKFCQHTSIFTHYCMHENLLNAVFFILYKRRLLSRLCLAFFD
jgi:hypothetical protein